MDRRLQARKKLFGKAAIQFLSSSGELVGRPVWVSLFDVSDGGLSFLFRITNSEKARLLLGRKLLVQLSSSDQSPPFKIQKKGDIVAVCAHPFDDYSFHVKFDSKLATETLSTLVRLFPSAPAA